MDHRDDLTPPERRPTPAPRPPRRTRPPLAEDADADLIAPLERGAIDAVLHALMQRHGGAVYRFCREALRDGVLADDVHQQTFLAAFQDIQNCRRSSTLRAWLFGIARHRVLDAAKARRRWQARIDEADPREVPDVALAPGAQLDDAQLTAVLIDCLRELDDDVRTALLLRYQQGFSFEEMSLVCGEKPGTLHARVARVLPILRTRIERRLGRARRAG